MRHAVCDDCGNVLDFDGTEIIPLSDVPRLCERLDVGGEVPAGACPKCGALMYLMSRGGKKRIVMGDRSFKFGPISVSISEKGRKIVLMDSENQRVNLELWKCAGKECSTWIDRDEVIWATTEGKLNTDYGLPFCDNCVPQEEAA